MKYFIGVDEAVDYHEVKQVKAMPGGIYYMLDQHGRFGYQQKVGEPVYWLTYESEPIFRSGERTLRISKNMIALIEIMREEMIG